MTLIRYPLGKERSQHDNKKNRHQKTVASSKYLNVRMCVCGRVVGQSLNQETAFHVSNDFSKYAVFVLWWNLSLSLYLTFEGFNLPYRVIVNLLGSWHWKKIAFFFFRLTTHIHHYLLLSWSNIFSPLSPFLTFFTP